MFPRKTKQVRSLLMGTKTTFDLRPMSIPLMTLTNQTHAKFFGLIEVSLKFPLNGLTVTPLNDGLTHPLR